VTSWPSDVVARYLTVGTATVDVTDMTWRSFAGSAIVSRSVSAACTGCNTAVGETTARERISYDPQEELFESALGALKTAAQSHAETCRAMPTPDGAR
jgi:hypothetical protein